MKIVKNVLCCFVYHSFTQWYAGTYEQLLLFAVESRLMCGSQNSVFDLMVI